MNRSTFYSLEDKFKFGKHLGNSLKNVIESDPGYLVWCLDNLSHFMLSADLIEDIRESYPSFPGNDLLDSHELYGPYLYEEDDAYYSCNDDYYEGQHYEEFAGSYVQDEMGWSDEMIYDALDGEPDAYWNID